MFGCPVSQASNLGQGISAENAEIPKLMFSFQKLNETPRILIEPLHLQLRTSSQDHKAQLQAKPLG